MDSIQHTVLNQINSKKIEGYRYLYNNYYASLCSFSSGFLRHREDAEDIVQDVFMRLWNGEATFHSFKALTSFLYLCVRNASLNARRDQKNVHIEDEDYNNFEFKEKTIVQRMIEEEFYRQIYIEINKLSPERRNIIMLSLEGFTNKEIADKTRVSVNTVKTLKLKTYRLLRDNLKQLVAFLSFTGSLF